MKLWLLGDPVAQSRSPLMHNAAYAEMGLGWEYAARRVPPDGLQEALRQLQAEGALGANLTIPHKELVLPHLSSLSERARLIGAANTLKFTAAGIEGDNTDGIGWLESWDEEIGQELADRPAIVVGAGGAARSIAWALRSRGVKELVVLNRNRERAAALSSHHAGLEDFAVHLQPGSVVVQTTSVGMWPEADSIPVKWPASLPAGVVACDLIYNPQETAFMRAARERGAVTLGGAGMLVHQAVHAIRWWSGEEDVPCGLMRQLLVRDLQN